MATCLPVGRTVTETSPLSVMEGVVQERVDRLPDTCRGGVGHARSVAPIDEGSTGLCIRVAPRLHSLPRQVGDIDHGHRFRSPSGGQRQQIRDDRLQPVDLLERCAGGRPYIRFVTIDQFLEPQADGRQRPAELMRGVGRELALRPNQRFDSTRTLVQRLRDCVRLGDAVD